MTEVKRTNYATGQFLTAADFTREQDYHRTLRRLRNANLNSWGVAGGLDVTKVDDTHVQVAPGLALDSQGREIVVTDPVVLDIAAQAGSTQLYLIIAYQEVDDPADKVTIGGVDAYVATTERPAFSFFDPGGNGTPANALPDDAITLALLTLDNGKVSAVDPGQRRPAGSLLAPTAKLADLAVSDRIDTGPVYFGGDRPGMSGIVPPLGAALIQNSVNDQALQIHGRTLSNGTGGTGPQRRLQLLDSVEVVGSLHVQALPGAATQAAQAGGVTVDGRIDAGGVSTAALSVNGTAYFGGSSWISGAGIATPDVFCTTLHVNGSVGGDLHVDRDVYIKGRVLVGPKSGYVMDRFVNRLGESLEIGDVVVLGAAPPTLAYGTTDIPVPEVDLTDIAGDTRVCGIVCEVHGESEGGEDGGMKVFTHDERADMNLATVAPGQLGHMVTLGTFAACKVDADIAPIAAGDLLTTSPTRGHAQKVLDRPGAIGAIVGKALAPLASGRGTIPILVTLH